MCRSDQLFQFPVINKVSSGFEASFRPLNIESPVMSTNDLSIQPHKYAIMPKPPVVSDTFNSKLHLSSEIEETINNDDYFKYVIYNIFNLIEDALIAKFTYTVDVEYKTRDESFGWRQANIFVTVYKIDFDVALELWREVGDKTEEFFRRLMISSKNIWPANKVEQLFDLISIEFDSSD